MDYLVIKVDRFRFAIDILSVKEILLSRNVVINDIDEIPRDMKIKYNGRDIRLFSLVGEIAKIKHTTLNKFSILLVNGDEAIGLIADAAEEIIKSDGFEKLPCEMAASEIDYHYLDFVLEQDDKLIHVLSLDKIKNLISSSS